MADRGALIELRIDTERIRRLAPLYASTLLNPPSGAPATIVSGDGDFRRVAESLQEALRERTGIEFRVSGDADFAVADALAAHAIAIGHAAGNRLIRRLQYLGYMGRGDYPSQGLRLVSVHSPFGDGRNVLAALGRTAEVAERGARRLLGRIVDRDGEWAANGRLHEIEGGPGSPDPGPCLEAARRQAKRGGRPEAMLRALSQFHASGEERWARAFWEIVRPYATGDIPLAFERMSAVDFWTDEVAVRWDACEEFPFFTEEERLSMANFVASCAEYCYDSITLQKWRIAEEDLQVFNHHTFPARSLFFACRYLRTHGYEIADLDRWEAQALRVFERAAQAGRSFDEGGGGYSWLVGNHLLQVGLARGDTRWASGDALRRYADLAVAVHNNRFHCVPFGDSLQYHNKTGRTGMLAEILLTAAEWQGDAGFKWAAERCDPETSRADVLTAHIDGRPPQRHLGLFVQPMDPCIHRWTDRPRFPGYPPPLRGTNVPPEKGFDKIALRGGWGRSDDYLLLQGFGDGAHGHPDANAISQYQARDRLWLVDCDYILRMPKQHNTIMAIRDGRHEPAPVTARLDAAEEFPGGALTQTSLLDYNGCDWRRTILWLKGDCLVVVDSLRAGTAGEYDLRCYWRTLGHAEIAPCGMRSEQDGEYFHVIELTDSRRRMDVEPPMLNTEAYPAYEYGDGAPKVLCERRKLRLEPGDETCFVNLLLPNGRLKPPRRAIAWTDNDGIKLGGDGIEIRLDPEGARSETGLCLAFREENRLTALRTPRNDPTPPAVRAPNSRPACAPVARLPAPAACLAWAGPGEVLVGCEDGTLNLVEKSGRQRSFDRREGGVGAVLCGRLYGESEPSLMATGRDCAFRVYTREGDLRWTVDLPPGSHLPGRGRAICLADLDGDGRLWPIVGTAGWQVHAVQPDAEFRWTFHTSAHSVTALAAADLNGDGRDEIAVGTVYFCLPAITADGGRLWVDEDYNDYWRAGPHYRWVEIADVDGDGDLEVVTAAADTLVHCIGNTGARKWTHSVGDDPAGIAVTSVGVAAASVSGDVAMLDAEGRRLWRRALDESCAAMVAVGDELWAATEEGSIHRLSVTGGALDRVRLPSPAVRMLADSEAAVWAASRDGSLFRIPNDGNAGFRGTPQC